MQLAGQIKKVATIGSAPVINSMVMPLGEGDKIVNDLPDFARNARWKYQYVFAPTMKGKPVMQNASNAPTIEELLKAEPDVVLTLDKPSVEIMERSGLPVVFLAWREPEDIKMAMTLLGEVFNKQAKAAESVKYLDDTLKKVTTAEAALSPQYKQKVLYFNINILYQTHLIVGWWITTAGLTRVTKDGRNVETVMFTLEQALQWDPSVILLGERIIPVLLGASGGKVPFAHRIMCARA